MGLTIKNEEMSIKMSYIGFAELRKAIAKLLNPDFAELYIALCKNKTSNEILNKKLNLYFEKGILKEEDNPILDFLFMSDCEGKLPAKSCKVLYNYDDNIKYGYCGRPDCAMFSDFKEIVRLCAKNRWVLKWD